MKDKRQKALAVCNTDSMISIFLIPQINNLKNEGYQGGLFLVTNRPVYGHDEFYWQVINIDSKKTLFCRNSDDNRYDSIFHVYLRTIKHPSYIGHPTLIGSCHLQ